MTTSPKNPFDRGAAEAAEYDAWYDTPMGRAVLLAEQQCVRELLEGAPHPWLDLGTGSGRFGGDLGADIGLDPAPDLLQLAAARMPAVIRSVGEALPLRDACLGAVLSVAVFEFLAAPVETMREVARVLRPGGRFIVGFFPRGSAWAATYEQQGRDPRSVFHDAHFLAVEEVEALAAAVGLQPSGTRGTLFEAPGAVPTGRVVECADTGAGFVASAFTRPSTARSRSR